MFHWFAHLKALLLTLKHFNCASENRYSKRNSTFGDDKALEEIESSQSPQIPVRVTEDSAPAKGRDEKK
jgi:hypothetical protein